MYIQGERPIIEKHIPQCIHEMIEKNWDSNPACRDTAEQLQQRVIAARDNCNLNESVCEKRSNSNEDAIHNTTGYTSKIITKPTFSTNVSNDGLIHGMYELKKSSSDDI
ncbi:hypothetical protein G9A89_013175 [Geosiphon pyriformis]|nr:hypothetical protein G9A89_013175 [Geosiphon pyriformis]